MHSHIVLDTDIFGDVDDFFALLYALSVSELSIELIVTVDECDAGRAQLTIPDSLQTLRLEWTRGF